MDSQNKKTYAVTVTKPSPPCSCQNNPLLINAVVETLFTHLNAEELKKCRYVCTTWKTEGFRFLRKLARVNLETKAKQKAFLDSSVSSNFNNFSFSFCEWNREVSSYLKLMQPTSLETVVTLILNKEDDGETVIMLDDLVNSFPHCLSKLVVIVDWAGTLRFKVPETLLMITYPQLKELTIKSDQLEARWLNPLWLAMVLNSPLLESLEIRKIGDEKFWHAILDPKTYTKLKSLVYLPLTPDVTRIHDHIIHSRLTFTGLQRLRIPFNHRIAAFPVESLLRRVARTLEVLEFDTIEESCLSPLPFPLLPKLKRLDSGNSQLSFPSITSDQLPHLEEIRVTYWDWVYSTENVPDTLYYWWTDNPHPAVRNVHIRFPTYSSVSILYRRLESFEEFARAIVAKFPAACNFAFHNVPLQNDIRMALERFFGICQDHIQSFRISSYCSAELVDPSPFEINVENDSNLRSLQELDLGTRLWSEIWGKREGYSDLRGETWIPKLINFENIRVLKLLWAKDLLLLLRLTDKTVLMNLEVLEFVGGICVNRMDRMAVRKCRPELKLVQHRTCNCPEEDWWYISDPNSSNVFENLFNSCKNKYGISSVLNALGLGFMSG